MLTGADGGAGLRVAAGARHPGDLGRDRAAPESTVKRGLARGLALAVALTALTALFLLALAQSLTSAANSDGAATILQAQAMLHGNPLLCGWWTSDVSFYTTELPEYMLVVAARGVSLAVVHICGALTYTLTVALAAILARGTVPGPAGWRRAALAVGIMLAPTILGGTEVFLENPDHFGTSVPVLLLLLLVERGHQPGRAGRPVSRRRGRYAVPVAACLLLALAQVGDELSLVAAAVPVAAVCTGRLAVPLLSAARRRRSSGRPGDPTAALSAAVREDGPLLAAALASIVVARLAQAAITALGGFQQQPIPGGSLAPVSQLPGNARLLGQSLMVLFGANNPGMPRRAITRAQHIPLVTMTDLHIVGLLLAGAGLVAGIAVWFSARPTHQRVDQILVAAIVITMAAAVGCSVLQSLANAHEVAILLPLSAALAGRVLPPLAARLAPARGSGRPARIVTFALAAYVAIGVAEMGYAAWWPAAPLPVQPVAAWLVAHHQREGLAAYWQAAETTVAAGGRVLVAPVTDSADGPVTWNASSDWYRPKLHSATFVLTEVDPKAGEPALPLAVIRARFGPPATEYRVGDDIILTYDYNLLTRLHGDAFTGLS